MAFYSNAKLNVKCEIQIFHALMESLPIQSFAERALIKLKVLITEKSTFRLKDITVFQCFETRHSD